MSRAEKGSSLAQQAALLMISTEPLLLEEAEKDVKQRLVPKEEQDLNALTLYGWEASLAPVLEFLQTLPFLGSRRLLVLREIHKFDEWKLLLDYLKNPNPTSTLLMTSSAMKRSGAPFKSLSAYAAVSEFKRPYGKNLTKWVAERFERSGKTIAPHLAEVLIQIAGQDLGILVTEIEKVVLSSGERPAIEQEDLKVSVPGGVEVVFNLLDALGDNNGLRALDSLRTLLMGNSQPEYLVHMMAWHYRQLLKGRELVGSGLSPAQAAEKMGLKFSGLKEKFARQVGRANQNNLVRALQVLADCDRELKRGQIPSGILLDRLVLELLV